MEKLPKKEDLGPEIPFPPREPRNREELIASIRRKRKSGEELDKEEMEYSEKEQAEDKKDDKPSYGRSY